MALKVDQNSKNRTIRIAGEGSGAVLRFDPVTPLSAMPYINPTHITQQVLFYPLLADQLTQPTRTYHLISSYLLPAAIHDTPKVMVDLGTVLPRSPGDERIVTLTSHSDTAVEVSYPCSIPILL